MRCLLGLLLLFPSLIKANLRKCLLLPIGDPGQGTDLSVLYNGINEYLLNSWCEPADVAVSEVLNKYSNNFERYLNEAEILEQISLKSGAGSLIFVRAIVVAGRIEVILKVMGTLPNQNYFYRERIFTEGDWQGIIDMVKYWLDEYEKKIPYQGIVTEINNDQIVVNIGRENNVAITDTLDIVRVSPGEIHPLVKEVVNFNLVNLGTARVFTMSSDDLRGEILRTFDGEKIAVGDGVIVKKTVNSDFDFPKIVTDRKKFGEIGNTNVKFVTGFSAADLSVLSGTNFAKSGLFLGGEVDTNIYIVNNLVFAIDVQLSGSNLERGVVDDNFMIGYLYRVKLNYSYMLDDYFLGSKIEAGLGYLGHRHVFVNNDRLGNIYAFSPILNINGIIPIASKFSLYMNADFPIVPRYTYQNDTLNIKGQKIEYANYKVSLRYLNSKNRFIDVGVIYQHTEIKPISSVSIIVDDLLFNVGVTYNF